MLLVISSVYFLAVMQQAAAPTQSGPDAIVMTGGRSLIASDFQDVASGRCGDVNMSVVRRPTPDKVDYYFRVNGKELPDLGSLGPGQIGRSPLRFYIRCNPYGYGEIVTLGANVSEESLKLVESRFSLHDERIIVDYLEKPIDPAAYWRWLYE